MKITPIQEVGDIWIKRDDLFTFAGMNGGKIRVALKLAEQAKGLVVCGSRTSLLCNIVAGVAQANNIPCVIHTQGGELMLELLTAKSKGAQIIQHGAVFNSVLKRRAHDNAVDIGFTEVPFGMEHIECVTQLRPQITALKESAIRPKRIVVPVGSGMTLAAIAANLNELGLRIPLLAVRIDRANGFKEAIRKLNRYCPLWRSMKIEMVQSSLRYYDSPEITSYGGVKLDSLYEAKCIEFLKPNDLLWVVGIRETDKE